MEDADHATWSERNFAFHQDLHALSGMPHFADVAGRVLTWKGFIISDNFTHSVNTPSKLKFTVVGGFSDWV